MCRLLEEGRKLRVSIKRSAAEAYRLLSASTSNWIAGTAGTRALRVTGPDSHGVLDYSVTPPGGPTTYAPLRVVGNGAGHGLVLTLFGKDNLSAEEALRSLLAARHVVGADAATRAHSTKQNVH